MILQNKWTPVLILIAAMGLSCLQPLVAEEMSTESAWKALPHYEYGQDMAAILAIDRVVIRAMRSPTDRSACAKRLASLLLSHETTLAARQAICLQLRQVGTPAEVPVLAKLLAKPETSQMARYALESIPGQEASAALRSALTTLRGEPLAGVIQSVSARKDLAALPVLQHLADSQDPRVATAAIGALGNITGDRAARFLADRAEQAGFPTPMNLAFSLLRCADAFLHAGQTGQAKTIYAKLSRPGQHAGVRRTALDGLLRLQGDQATTTILAWLSAQDPERRQLAMGHLHALPDDKIDQLLSRFSELPNVAKLVLIDLGIARREEKIVPLAHTLIESDQPELKLAGIRCLGLVGDASVIPVLIQALSASNALSTASQDALTRLPSKEVVPALLDALRKQPAIRIPVIRVLVKLKSRDAIDPLIELASQSDPAQYAPALNGLRELAHPDKADIARLIDLLRKTERGKHRDEVEKTILIACGKLPENVDRAQPVLAILAGDDRMGSDFISSHRDEAIKCLPLLGRLGGPKALQLIQKGIASEDAAVRESATRALCNWPNAEVADRLLELAKTSKNPAYCRWALRAYIRVITLKSDRPEATTLAMLKNAMTLAERVDEKRLALRRAPTIRTLETVRWIVPYLDDPELAQTACRAIVELAHHRFLRHPNMDLFDPILKKVERISNDPVLAERAKRYRLGL